MPDKLGVAIRESLLNVNHHAYLSSRGKPEISWWSYVYVGEDDEDGQYLATVITDRGAGIPNTIRNTLMKAHPLKQVIYKERDSPCILEAMKESVTRTGELGRGKGSVDMKKPVQIKSKLGQHRLLILSNSGRYSYEVDRNGKVVEHASDMKGEYHGTLVEWFLYFEGK